MVAALLHDILEDTDTKYIDLEKEFSPKIASIVLELTDPPGMSRPERRQRQIEHGPKKSNEAKLVKIADKIYNLRDMKNSLWDQATKKEYADFCLEVVNGMRGTNAELERQFDELYKEYA